MRRATTIFHATLLAMLATPERDCGAMAMSAPLVGKQKRVQLLANKVSTLPRSADVPTLASVLSGQNLKPQNLTTLLLTLKRRQRWRVSGLMAEWAERADCPVEFSTTHYNLLIAACAKRAPKRALHILSRMRERGVHPDVVTLNTAMTAAMAADEPRAALATFDEMRAAEIAPSTISYNTAISACARCADAELALSLFREMEADGVERTTVTYTGLIHACAEGMQLDKAMALFTYMEVAGVERNLVTYSVAINACTRNGQWELGLQLLHEMARRCERSRSSSMHPPVHVQHPVHRLMCTARTRMACARRRRIEPDAVVFNAAISACEKGRAWDTALRLMAQMRVLGIQPTAVTYGAAISACEKGKQWQRAMELLEQMAQDKIKPNTIVYSAAISACGSAGEWEAALGLLHQMGASGVPRNTISYVEHAHPMHVHARASSCAWHAHPHVCGVCTACARAQVQRGDPGVRQRAGVAAGDRALRPHGRRRD